MTQTPGDRRKLYIQARQFRGSVEAVEEPVGFTLDFYTQASLQRISTSCVKTFLWFWLKAGAFDRRRRANWKKNKRLNGNKRENI